MFITYIIIGIGIFLWIYMLIETFTIYYKHKVLSDYRNSRRQRKI